MDFEKNIVVFDWNGTIVDDTFANFKGANAALSSLGRAPVSLGEYKRKFQVPTRAMFESFGCSGRELEEKRDMFFKAFYATYKENTACLRLRTGARRVLRTLQVQEIQTAVLSNSSVGKIALQAQKASVAHPFDAVLANEVSGTAFHKGKGGRLESFLNEQKIKRAIVVGDTVEEIHIARKQGCVAVALSGGACSTERLAKAKPDFLIGELKALPPIVSKIFGCAL